MGTGDDAALSGENGVRSVLPLGGGTAYLFVLAVSIIGMAGEYRHGKIGHTLLAAPERWRVIGVGLAALLKDQVLALFTGIGLTLLIDLILSGVVPEVNKFLPGGALSGLLNGAGEDLLDPPLGGLVLLGYAALFVLAGALVSQRRDLT